MLPTNIEPNIIKELSKGMSVNEVCLSIRPNTGINIAFHILPMGVPYQAMHSVCLHSVILCALTGGDMSVTASPEAISSRRPSVYFVLTSPLHAIL